jgi:hypothetical protein
VFVRVERESPIDRVGIVDGRLDDFRIHDRRHRYRVDLR